MVGWGDHAPGGVVGHEADLLLHLRPLLVRAGVVVALGLQLEGDGPGPSGLCWWSWWGRGRHYCGADGRHRRLLLDGGWLLLSRSWLGLAGRGQEHAGAALGKDSHGHLDERQDE